MRSRVLQFMQKMKSPQAYDKAWSQEPIVSQIAQQFTPEQSQEPQVTEGMLPGFEQDYSTPLLEESLPTSAAAPIQETSAEMVPQKRLMQGLRNRVRKFDNAQAKQRGELVYG